MSKIKINTPLTTEVTEQLNAGDEVLISGFIYTARDAAHMRLIALMDENKPLPIPLEGEVIYYVGPSLARLS